jgi:hypothetical protein
MFNHHTKNAKMQNPMENYLIDSHELKDENGHYDSEVAKVKLHSFIERLQVVRESCWKSCIRLKGTVNDLQTGELVCIDRCAEKHIAAYDAVLNTLKPLHERDAQLEKQRQLNNEQFIEK